MTTPVIYRKSEGETVAIFPREPYDNHSGLITCYAHVGQHSACSWDWVLEDTTEPTEEDIAKLHSELTDRGYYNIQSIPLQDYMTLEGV